MDQQTFQIRTALMPLFCKDFHCLAADCRDNCCGGWNITFNKKDYLKIKRAARSEALQAVLSGGMSRLRDNASMGYAHFELSSEGACAFQTREGLCLLQQECGEDALPEVCRTYPRKFIYTPAAREFTLSPSCEAVLALLWDLPQGIDFLEEDLPRRDWKTVEVDPPMVRFADIRSFCIDVLQERSLSLSRRMLMLGLLLRRLKELDWTEEGVVDQWLDWGAQQLRDPSAAAELERLPRDRKGFLTDNIRTLMDLYRTGGRTEREACRSLLSALSAEEDWEGGETFSIDLRRYETMEGRLDALLGRSDAFFENLMVMTALYQIFPGLMGPDALWRSYAELCLLYGFFRFSAVCGCYQDAGRERLFQVLVAASRGLLHNHKRRGALVDTLLQNGGTLAQMAVLTGG